MLPPICRKLRPVAKALYLTEIIGALDNGEYRSALVQIDAYLARRPPWSRRDSRTSLVCVSCSRSWNFASNP